MVCDKPAVVTEPVLAADGLVKTYRGKRVVDDLSIECRAGTILGLLGPNGAGKTTTLRMLYGLVEPEAGTICYEGQAFDRHKTRLKRWIGVCAQDDTLDYDFSVVQNLRVYASYFRPRVEDLNPRIDELMAQFDLGAFAEHSPRELSGGYKRRLMIARSIVHRPKALFLDEPTTGLDPRARVQVWELIARLRAEGMAIVLTTHYMDEAERLSDQLVVLSHGRVIARGSPAEVLGDLLGEHVLVVPSVGRRGPEIEAWAMAAVGARPASVLGEARLPVTTDRAAEFSEKFADVRFFLRPPNLDDLFLQLSETPDASEDGW